MDIKEWNKGMGRAKGMDSALWVMQGDCRNAAASLPPRSGADGSRVCGCTSSFCLPQELAKEWVVELVSSPTSANEQPLFGESPEMRVLESWNEMARVDFVPF